MQYDDFELFGVHGATRENAGCAPLQACIGRDGVAKTVNRAGISRSVPPAPPAAHRFTTTIVSFATMAIGTRKETCAGPSLARALLYRGRGRGEPVVPVWYMDKGTIRLEVPSRLQMLDLADSVVGQVAKAAGFDEERRQDIQAAVHESLVNAILHGNQGDEARRVTLEVDPDGGGLEIRVRDQGRGFDPTRLPDPRAHENLSRTSGRGILLMKAFMDAVTFRRLRSGGMEVTMRKRLAAEVESARASYPAGAARA